MVVENQTSHQTKKDILAPIRPDMARLNDVVRTTLHSEVPLVNQVAEYLINAGGKRLRPAIHLLLTIEAQVMPGKGMMTRAMYPDPVQWIEWLVGILLTVAGISVIYAGFLYYGFERVSRPSPSRFNTWVWIGLAAGLGAIAVAVMLVTGLIR